MSSQDPRAIGGRILDLALAVFFAAMALYGAVQIIRAIWIWLCIGIAACAVAAGIWWILRSRF